jgi:integrase
MRLEDVTPEAIERWKPTLSVSNRTVHKYLVVMHGIFKRALKVWGLPRDPMTAVERPRIRVSDDLHAFSPEEIHALVRAATSEHDGAVFLTAAFTGLRMGELLALQWADVDFGGQSIRVRRSYNAHGGLSSPKSGKVRSVPMVPDVASALAALGTRELLTGDEDLVLPGDFGEYMDGSALRARGTQRAPLPRPAPHVRHARGPPRRGAGRPGMDGPLGDPDDHALRPLPRSRPRG